MLAGRAKGGGGKRGRWGVGVGVGVLDGGDRVDGDGGVK